jgi:hypothetical protein
MFEFIELEESHEVLITAPDKVAAIIADCRDR